jgi:hypothetical protein
MKFSTLTQMKFSTLSAPVLIYLVFCLLEISCSERAASVDKPAIVPAAGQKRWRQRQTLARKRSKKKAEADLKKKRRRLKKKG